MRITWRDGVTTLLLVGALLMERAYFFDWNMPMASSVRETVIVIGLISLGIVIIGYLLDKNHDLFWFSDTSLLVGMTMLLVTAGLLYPYDSYLFLLTVNTVLLWAGSIAHHMATPR